jgi:hypothetical protein
MIKRVRNVIEPGYLISEDGILYEGSDLGHARLFVPEKLIRPILELHHDKVFAGHQGAKRTCDLVKMRYFWPNIDRDIEAYVQQCDSCAKFKAGRQPTAPLVELPGTTFPFEKTSIDICGPYPETRRGNRYLLTLRTISVATQKLFLFPYRIFLPSRAFLLQRSFRAQVVFRHCYQIEDLTLCQNFFGKCVSY